MRTLAAPRVVKKLLIGLLLTATMNAAAIVMLPARPAHGLAGGALGALLSAYAYKKCIDANRELCELLLLDPPGVDVTSLDLLIKYDPAKVEVDPTALFLCDFSNGGPCPPVITAIIGTPQPLAPDPGLDVSLATPRAGTSFTFTNDTSTGTLQLHYDMSGNPAPGEGVRNVFGFGLYLDPSLADATHVKYFDVPGTYDITFVSASCTTADLTNICASDNPIAGINFVTPEPSTLFLLVAGGLGLGYARRRRK